MAMPDERVGYRLIPNISRNAFTSDFQIIYTTNSLGLREKEIESTSKFRILFLGDSQTFGEGVPFGSRFSDLIEKETGNVYSINAGVPGYGIHNMYWYLKYYGLNLKPNLVVCVVIPIDLGRAVYKESKNPPYLFKSGKKTKYSERKEIDFFRDSKKALLNHSYFYAVVRARVKTWFIWHALEERDRKAWAEIAARKDNGGYYKILSQTQLILVKEESFKIFRDFKNLLRDSQIEFLVVNIGSRALPWLEDYFNQEDINYLDVSFVLKNASNITFKIDPHYNNMGHRIIADYIKAYILKKHPDLNKYN